MYIFFVVCICNFRHFGVSASLISWLFGFRLFYFVKSDVQYTSKDLLLILVHHFLTSLLLDISMSENFYNSMSSITAVISKQVLFLGIV